MRNALLPLLVSAALAGSLSAQDDVALARGGEVYGAMCGRCHNARSPLERTDREWVTIINHMRVRANLSGRQTRDVLAFLQGTNTDPRAVLVPPEALAAAPVPRVELTGPVPTDRATIVRGDSLVTAKACRGCHVIGRTGGNVGPSLNGVVGRRGAPFVRQKLGSPTFDNAASMMPNFGLTAGEIEAITAFLAARER